MTLLKLVLLPVMGGLAYLLYRNTPVPSVTKGLPIGFSVAEWFGLLVILFFFVLLFAGTSGKHRSDA